MTAHILTEAEKETKYDAERAGTLYTLAPAEQPASGFKIEQAAAAYAAMVAARPAHSGPKTGDELPFGQLKDGTPITGVYDAGEPNGRAGLVRVQLSDYIVTAEGFPNLLTIGSKARYPSLSDMTIDDINSLRAFLATDIPEQLLASAAAHQNGDEPPPANRKDLLIGHIDGVPVLANYSDETDQLYCVEIVWQGVKVSTNGADYINLPTDDSLGCVGDFHVRDWQVLARANVIDRLVALAQANPTFPPTMPLAGASAIEVECLYHDPNEGGDITDQPVGPLAYVDYILGKGDMRACVSHDMARGPMVELCNGDLISLDDAEHYCHNLLALLNDPRVQAARAEVVNEHR